MRLSPLQHTPLHLLLGHHRLGAPVNSVISSRRAAHLLCKFLQRISSPVALLWADLLIALLELLDLFGVILNTAAHELLAFFEELIHIRHLQWELQRPGQAGLGIDHLPQRGEFDASAEIDQRLGDDLRVQLASRC
jgi:hypothetical protein